MYGLQRMNQSPANKSPVQRKKFDNLSPKEQSDSKSEKEFSHIQEDSFSNTEIELEDFEYKAEISDISNKSDLIIAENDDDEEENEDLEDTDLDYSSSSAKPSSEVRLDLINEINDEFLDEDILVVDGKSSGTGGENVLSRFDDEEDDDKDDYYMSDDDDSGNINLTNFRILIDNIDEVIDKSNNNKTCYVFVIQVWNLDPMHPENKSSNEKPSWFVKRKYDEFFVLDARLREFHGGLISSADFNIRNPNQITVQLPPKQRALFFNNKDNDLDYLSSVQNDFEKYLQVKINSLILSKMKP